ncbi:Abelson tyrosine-protein kinase 2 [Biomphalaria glabrata]|uniref:Uncharacterized protein LOC106078000 n=1 Tax=Biomphalaria glabrata TaxID=6526 RepID=A0A9W2YVI6_BIOGL|nr:uncharacterized protein LOC106078000 [Biomphalaria glabrata]KAI8734775.1 Abelson tyrosine-protein kinase 2-like [Biomphalaria glabrata]
MIEILKQLDHDHILKLFAYRLTTIPKFNITEYYSNNLQDFLANKNKNHKYCNEKTLLLYLLQTSSALEHCHSKNIVHSNLMGASLFLVSKEKVMLGEFSLAVQLNISKEILLLTEDTQSLPIRWTAPETLKERKVSLKSDVAMFGNLMYEVLTHGVLPYSRENLSEEEFFSRAVHFLIEPHRESCFKDDYYKLMLSCTHHRPERRPDIKNVQISLQHFLDNYSDDEVTSYSFPNLHDGTLKPSTQFTRGLPQTKKGYVIPILPKLEKVIQETIHYYKVGQFALFRETVSTHMSRMLVAKVQAGILDEIIPRVDIERVKNNSRTSYVIDILLPANCSEDLCSLIDNNQVGQSPDSCLHLILKAAEMLKYFHDNNFILGQLKMSDIVIDMTSETLKIYPISLRHMIYKTSSTDSSSTTRQSPYDNIACSFETDVFIFGRFMKELLLKVDAMKRPTWYSEPNTMDSDSVNMEQLNMNSCPASMYTLMDKCMQKMPQDRPKLSEIIRDVNYEINNIKFSSCASLTSTRNTQFSSEDIEGLTSTRNTQFSSEDIERLTSTRNTQFSSEDIEGLTSTRTTQNTITRHKKVSQNLEAINPSVHSSLTSSLKSESLSFIRSQSVPSGPKHQSGFNRFASTEMMVLNPSDSEELSGEEDTPDIQVVNQEKNFFASHGIDYHDNSIQEHGPGDTPPTHSSSNLAQIKTSDPEIVYCEIAPASRELISLDETFVKQVDCPDQKTSANVKVNKTSTVKKISAFKKIQNEYVKKNRSRMQNKKSFQPEVKNLHNMAVMKQYHSRPLPPIPDEERQDKGELSTDENVYLIPSKFDTEHNKDYEIGHIAYMLGHVFSPTPKKDISNAVVPSTHTDYDAMAVENYSSYPYFDWPSLNSSSESSLSFRDDFDNYDHVRCLSDDNETSKADEKFYDVSKDVAAPDEHICLQTCLSDDLACSETLSENVIVNSGNVGVSASYNQNALNFKDTIAQHRDILQQSWSDSGLNHNHVSEDNVVYSVCVANSASDGDLCRKNCPDFCNISSHQHVIQNSSSVLSKTKLALATSNVEEVESVASEKYDHLSKAFPNDSNLNKCCMPLTEADSSDDHDTLSTIVYYV